MHSDSARFRCGVFISLHILHAVQSACEAQNTSEIRGFRFFLEGDMLSARNQGSLCRNSMVAPKALVIYPNVPQSCYSRTAPWCDSYRLEEKA